MQRVDQVEALGWLVTGAGAVSCAAGIGAWLTVRSQLAAERIVVAGSAPWLAGCPVKGPFTAFAQAEAIRRTALTATGGRTYGELDATDPSAEMAMNASLLRSSLFTSVLASALPRRRWDWARRWLRPGWPSGARQAAALSRAVVRDTMPAT